LRRIAPVLVAAVGLDDEARPVAGRAVAPVELRASAAARAARRIARLEAVERRRRAAPGAGLHPLGHRPFAASALILRLEHRPVAALELAEQHLLPQGWIDRVALLLRRTLLFLRRTVPEPLELGVHRDGVPVALLRAH